MCTKHQNARRRKESVPPPVPTVVTLAESPKSQCKKMKRPAPWHRPFSISAGAALTHHRGLRGRVRRRSRQNDDVRPEMHAAVEILDVVIRQPDAARRHEGADGRR